MAPKVFEPLQFLLYVRLIRAYIGRMIVLDYFQCGRPTYLKNNFINARGGSACRRCFLFSSILVSLSLSLSLSLVELCIIQFAKHVTTVGGRTVKQRMLSAILVIMSLKHMKSGIKVMHDFFPIFAFHFILFIV